MTMHRPRDFAPAFDLRLRDATPDDADALCRFVDMAGDGLPVHLWRQMAAPGQDPYEVGRARARRDTGGFSWRNAMLAERSGRVVGGLIGYPLAAAPGPGASPPNPLETIPPQTIPSDTPPLFRPLLELEATAAGHWYVNVLAVDPGERGRGLGTRLLAAADGIAAAGGLDGIALIVADDNHAARRLYEACGYRPLAERAVVADGWTTTSQRWILMTKRL